MEKSGLSAGKWLHGPQRRCATGRIPGTSTMISCEKRGPAGGPRVGPRVGPRAGWRTSRGESIAWPSPWFPGPMGGAASSERSRWLAVTRRAAGRRRLHLPTGGRAGSLWAGRSPPAPSRAARAATATSARAASRSAPSPGRHCHSTLSLAVIDRHSLGIYTVILLPLLPFSVKMTVSPWAIGTTCFASQ